MADDDTVDDSDNNNNTNNNNNVIFLLHCCCFRRHHHHHHRSCRHRKFKSNCLISCFNILVGYFFFPIFLPHGLCTFKKYCKITR